MHTTTVFEDAEWPPLALDNNVFATGPSHNGGVNRVHAIAEHYDIALPGIVDSGVAVIRQDHCNIGIVNSESSTCENPPMAIADRVRIGYSNNTTEVLSCGLTESLFDRAEEQSLGLLGTQRKWLA